MSLISNKIICTTAFISINHKFVFYEKKKSTLAGQKLCMCAIYSFYLNRLKNVHGILSSSHCDVRVRFGFVRKF